MNQLKRVTMKENMTKIWKVVKNKYVATTLIFLAIILFFDENNLMVTRSLYRQVRDLKVEEKELSDGIVADSAQVLALKNNLDAIERYGRETYYLKRADEDLYIIKNTEK